LAAAPAVAGATVVIEGAPNRPPLEPSSSADLFALAQEVAASRGLDPLKGVAVGGASDGNFTAGIGIPTLDGLGAVGDHAHAEGEWASVAAMPARAALVAGLVRRLLAG
jgi:glutamate carboxypeptidase